MTRFALIAGFLAAGAAGAAMTPGWSAYAGGDNDTDGVLAVTSDAAGNSFIGGFLGEGWMHTGTDTIFETSAYGRGFVARVSPQGGVDWAADFGGNDNYYDEVRALAAGSSALAAAGVTSGSPSDEGSHAFVAALDTDDGSVAWIVRIGNLDFAGTNGFSAVATDAAGYIYAAGHTTLPNQPCNVAGREVGGVVYGTNLQGRTDALVVKLNPDGAIVWRRYLGGVNADRATACLVAPDGSIFIGGETQSPGWASLPSGTPGIANPCGFLVKLNPDGSHCWSTFLGGSGQDAVTALAYDTATGSVCVGGRTLSADFRAGDPRLNSHAGGTDGFVMRLTDTNTAFRTEWCRFTGGGSLDDVTALAVRDGVIAAGGSTASGGWLPQASNAYQGGKDGFIMLLDSAGAVTVSAYVGGSRDDTLHALAATSAGLVSGGTTFSSSWVSGGFWDTWSKNEFWGGGDFGFVATWEVAETPDDVPPEIIAEPADVSVQEGQPVVFSVEATGTAPLTYRWYCDDLPIPGAESNAYTLAAASLADDNSAYCCVVSNAAGTATSRAALLTVTPLPQPVYATRVIDGSNVTITVTPPAGTMVWMGSEILPAGLELGALPSGANWDSDTRTLAYSGSGTNTAIFSYTLFGTNGIYALSGNVRFFLPAEIQAAVAGDTEVVFANVLRSVSGTAVTVIVTPPAGAVYVWSVEESLPEGLTPQNITGPGAAWDPATRKLTWVRLGSDGATLFYEVSGAPGTYELDGRATFGGPYETVGGDSSVTVPEPPPDVPAPDILAAAMTAGGFEITFVSIEDQQYMIQTNAVSGPDGWADCITVEGNSGTTSALAPLGGARLFYKVREKSD